MADGTSLALILASRFETCQPFAQSGVNHLDAAHVEAEFGVAVLAGQSRTLTVKMNLTNGVLHEEVKLAIPRFRYPRTRLAAGCGAKDWRKSLGAGFLSRRQRDPPEHWDASSTCCGWRSRDSFSWCWRWSAAGPQFANTIVTPREMDLTSKMLLASAFALVFAYFGVSSFWRSRKKIAPRFSPDLRERCSAAFESPSRLSSKPTDFCDACHS